MTTTNANPESTSTEIIKRCECGCGAAITPRNRFVLGHQVRKQDHYVEMPGPLKTPCWIWQLAVLPNGYGLERRGEMVYAHRAAYEDAHGEIAAGLSSGSSLRQPRPP